MKTALITGSFDPITRGHADLIARTAAIFDSVEVVIFRNSEKTPLFSEEQRLLWLSAVCTALGGNIRAAAADGTVVDYAKTRGVNCIVKGIRNGADLTYEKDMAALNRMAGGPETLFLPTDPTLAHISSGAVREFLRHGIPAEELLPPAVTEEIIASYHKKSH